MFNGFLKQTSTITIRFYKKFSCIAYGLALMLALAGNSEAADVTLVLKADLTSQAAGFRIYYKTGTPGAPYDGTGINQGSSPVDIPIGAVADPQNAEISLTGLQERTDYFFTATIYDAYGNESSFSNQEQYTPPSTAPTSYTITSSSGGNGAISPTGANTVTAGDNVTYTISADACFSVGNVIVDGKSIGAVNSYTFNSVAADHTISATFVPKTYTITAESGIGGHLTPSGVQYVSCGQSLSFAAVPNAGYHITALTVDGVFAGMSSDYTFSNICAGHTIAASFGLDTSTPTNPNDAYGNLPWLLPGIIEAEDYDQGGERVGYHDLTAGNKGAQYRSDDVDIWYSRVAGYYIGAASSSEWLAYAVDVDSSGTYSLDLQVATPNSGRTLHLEMDGTDISGPIVLPNTGSWSAWQTVSASVKLSAGSHVLRVVFDQGGLNFNWMEFNAGPATPIPGIIEAEDYDQGGEGVGYHDLTAGNKGAQYRSDDVDIWYSRVAGYYIGAASSSEWLAYAVDVDSSGAYSLDLQVATPYNGRTMHVELDGIDITGPVILPNTGSWSVWRTVSVDVSLAEGRHVMRAVFDKGGLNFNWIHIY